MPSADKGSSYLTVYELRQLIRKPDAPDVVLLRHVRSFLRASARLLFLLPVMYHQGNPDDIAAFPFCSDDVGCFLGVPGLHVVILPFPVPVKQVNSVFVHKTLLSPGRARLPE